MITQPIQVIPE